MQKQFFLGLGIGTVVYLFSSQTYATPVFTLGAGNSVSIMNYSATFDAIVSGQSLVDYTEDNLVISVDDTAYLNLNPGTGFDNHFYYGNGGNNSYVSLATEDGQKIMGLEFLIGSGRSLVNDGAGYLAWEIYDDGRMAGSGFSYLDHAGYVVGWKDSEGFDELRVGYSYLPDYEFGQIQGIALDNVRVQTDSFPVPEPATAMLFALGLAGLAGTRRTKKE